ncbi:MAG: lytic transglycosylase domain-containing protein [Pseudomonadota bacterium]|nr:lytic transglycosylase domain-containing protein [Pseudomonadota bacterium]
MSRKDRGGGRLGILLLTALAALPCIGAPPPPGIEPMAKTALAAGPVTGPVLRRPLVVNRVNQRLYRRHIDKIARQHRLEPALVHAVIAVESGYNPKAVSPKGAMGLMQLMPDTARLYNVRNPFDPVANIRAGVRYLRALMDRFRSVRLALAAYNAGPEAVRRHRNQVPPYQETQHYVVRVLNYYTYHK